MAFRNYILVCGGTACGRSRVSRSTKSDHRLRVTRHCREAQIVKTGCFGFASRGPIVKILPEDAFYVKVTPEDAAEIVSEHIIMGRQVQRLLYDKSRYTPRPCRISF